MTRMALSVRQEVAEPQNAAEQLHASGEVGTEFVYAVDVEDQSCWFSASHLSKRKSEKGARDPGRPIARRHAARRRRSKAARAIGSGVFD